MIVLTNIVEVVALKKDRECYVLVYNSARETQAISAAIDWAQNPALSFTWLDACRVFSKIRSGCHEAA